MKNLKTDVDLVLNMDDVRHNFSNVTVVFIMRDILNLI